MTDKTSPIILFIGEREIRGARCMRERR